MILYQIVYGEGWSWILTHRLTVIRERAILFADNSHELDFERNFDEYV
ncbi:MAG: hypothetical protein LBK25_09115 [Treponema sp.]|jgi:hypothetical protein|nr:hypothetical protein [Treponema sp.]